MRRELCNGCLKGSRAHRFNPNTVMGICGVCRKEVGFTEDEFDRRCPPVRHFIKKRGDPHDTYVNARRGSRGEVGTGRSGRR
jgi:hypothetical protein